MNIFSIAFTIFLLLSVCFISYLIIEAHAETRTYPCVYYKIFHSDFAMNTSIVSERIDTCKFGVSK